MLVIEGVRYERTAHPILDLTLTLVAYHMPEAAHLVGISTPKLHFFSLKWTPLINLHLSSHVTLHVLLGQRIARGRHPLRRDNGRIGIFDIMDKDAAPGVGENTAEPDKIGGVCDQDVVVLNVHGEVMTLHELFFDIRLTSTPEHVPMQAAPCREVKGVAKGRAVLFERSDERRSISRRDEIHALVSAP